MRAAAACLAQALALALDLALDLNLNLNLALDMALEPDPKLELEPDRPARSESGSWPGWARQGWPPRPRKEAEKAISVAGLCLIVGLAFRLVSRLGRISPTAHSVTLELGRVLQLAS